MLPKKRVPQSVSPRTPSIKYEESVFINCPFDGGYNHILNALIFAVFECGFVARSALELSDGASTRIDKIYNLILGSKYGIHDISCTDLDPINNLPRFNMPLELGIFLGAREYGDRKQQSKCALILDREKHRYQKFCSDIAGSDIYSHDNDPEKAISCVRKWLVARPETKNKPIVSAAIICDHYRALQNDLPALCKASGYDETNLEFNDYVQLIHKWIVNVFRFECSLSPASTSEIPPQ